MTEILGNLFNSNQKKIGLLLDNLSVGFTQLLWQEINRLSEIENLTLFLFPCDVNNHTHLHLEKTIKFIQESNLDGLIVLTNTLTTFLTIEDVAWMCSQVAAIPIVSIGIRLESATCNITAEQKEGFRDCIKYLIEDMQCKKIAFVKGNENHEHTQLRLEVYREMLKHYHLEYDEAYIVNGDYFIESGSNAVTTLYDIRNLRPDAIVCCNDEMALGALQALEQKKIQIPNDVIVTGYDNIPDIQYEGSMLATVSQPISNMANAAVLSLLNLLQHQTVEKDILLPSFFIWRASAGFGVSHTRESLFLRDDPSYGKNGKDGGFTIPETLLKQLNANRTYQSFMVEGIHHFMSSKTNEALLLAIQHELPKAGVRTCFIGLMGNEVDSVLYEGKEPAYEGKESAFKGIEQIDTKEDNIGFLWGYNDQNIYEYTIGSEDTNAHIEKVTLSKRRYTVIIEPLFYGNHYFGYIAYELGIEIGSFYELIRRQICSALNMIALLEEQSAINKRLNETLNNLKQTQSQLIQSEKMAALGTLVAGVAHEINTPVGIGVSAISYMNLQVTKLHEDMSQNRLTKNKFEGYMDSFEESCTIIASNLKKAAQLITSFKNIAVDQTSEELRTFELKKYIEDVIMSLKPKFKKRNIHIEMNCPDFIVMYSYPGALSQIITNIVLNAIIHGFESVDDGTIIIEVQPFEKYVIIEISDNGCGISEEHLKKIFDPFFTTKRGIGGSGLGLHIVYNLVTQTLKGSINCKSTTNEGTKFTIQLPLTAKTMEV